MSGDTSSFKGGTSEANFELGKRLALGGWSMRPVLAADVFNNTLKGTTEAGSGNEAVIYDKTSVTQMFIRTGTDLRHRTKDYTFNSGIYYAYDRYRNYTIENVEKLKKSDLNYFLVSGVH